MFIIREVNSDMPIYVNRTEQMLEKIKCPERDLNPRHPDLTKGALMRSGCHGFESCSGHLIFSSIQVCSVYIDRHIRVDHSDDEQCSKYAMLYTFS